MTPLKIDDYYDEVRYNENWDHGKKTTVWNTHINLHNVNTYYYLRVLIEWCDRHENRSRRRVFSNKIMISNSARSLDIN